MEAIEYLAYGVKSDGNIATAYVGFLIAAIGIPVLILSICVFILKRKKQNKKAAANNEPILVLLSAIVVGVILSLLLMNGFGEGRLITQIGLFSTGILALGVATSQMQAKKTLSYGNTILAGTGVIALVVAIGLIIESL